jgi:hypothetical protein
LWGKRIRERESDEYDDRKTFDLEKKVGTNHRLPTVASVGELLVGRKMKIEDEGESEGI